MNIKIPNYSTAYTAAIKFGIVLPEIIESRHYFSDDDLREMALGNMYYPKETRVKQKTYNVSTTYKMSNIWRNQKIVNGLALGTKIRQIWYFQSPS